jgi:pimeloyl-ACP methyl ester carboxylesterase
MDDGTNTASRVDTTPWILLRGLTRESRHWGSFAARIENALPGSRVIALDLPGNGRLHQQRSPMRAQDMVEHCRDQLTARHIAAPYRLLAMSLGAMVAVAWASTYPHEIATQVLINTSMRPFSPFHERLRPANYVPLLKLIIPGTSPDAWEQTILRMTSNHADRYAVEGVLTLWLAWREANPVSRGNALRQLVAAALFCAPKTRPPIPTLLLASTQDRLVSVACSVALAMHWQGDLRIHPSAGHDLPLDDGPWVADQVKDWLMRQVPHQMLPPSRLPAICKCA